MEHIRQLVISNKEPKDIYVGWLKPQPDGKYQLYFHNRGEWFNILEHLESRQIFNHIDSTATLAGIIHPNSTPKDTIFPVFYIAKEAGIYSYFDEIKIDNPSILYKVNEKWEAVQISGSSSIDISSIQDNSISGSKIQDDSISENKIAENSIGNSKIQENAITENKLALELQEKINNNDVYAKQQDLIKSNKRIENLEAIDHSKYLTEHQSLDGYAKTTDLHSHTNKEVLDNITSDKVTSWDNKSDFSGSYNDLTDKPTIPSEYILPTASADTIGGIKVGAGLSINNGVLSANGGGTADSIDWSNVQNRPTIPSKTSDLTNDSGFISDVSNLATKQELNNVSNRIPSTEGLLSKTQADSLYQEKGNYLTEHQSLAEYAKKTDIPSLNGYATETWVTNKGYLTEHQSLDAYYNKTEVDNKLSGKLNDAPAVIKKGAIDIGAVQTSNIEDSAITTNKIVDGAVGADKIAQCGVQEPNLDDLSVSTRTIINNAVTQEKLGTGSVTSEKIADGAVLEKHLGFTLSSGTVQDSSITLTKLSDNIIPYDKTDVRELQPFNSARLRNKFLRSYNEFNTNGTAEDFDSLYIDIKTKNGNLYPNNITANLLRYIKVRRLSARMQYNNKLSRTDRVYGKSYNNWVQPMLHNSNFNNDQNVTLINTIDLEKYNRGNVSVSYKLNQEVLKQFIIQYLKEEKHDIPYYTAHNTTLGTSINITPYIETIEIKGITLPVNRIIKYNPKKIIITSQDSSNWVGTANVIGISEVEEHSVENIYGRSCCKLKLQNTKLGEFTFDTLKGLYSTDNFDIYIYINDKAPDFFKKSYQYQLVYSSEGYSASKTASNYNITNLISYCNKKQLVQLGFPMFKWGKTPIKPILKNSVFMYEFTIGIQHNIFGLVPIKALLYYNEKTNEMCFRFKNSSKYSTCSIYPY